MFCTIFIPYEYYTGNHVCRKLNIFKNIFSRFLHFDLWFFFILILKNPILFQIVDPVIWCGYWLKYLMSLEIKQADFVLQSVATEFSNTRNEFQFLILIHSKISIDGQRIFWTCFIQKGEGTFLHLNKFFIITVQFFL